MMKTPAPPHTPAAAPRVKADAMSDDVHDDTNKHADKIITASTTVIPNGVRASPHDAPPGVVVSYNAPTRAPLVPPSTHAAEPQVWRHCTHCLRPLATAAALKGAALGSCGHLTCTACTRKGRCPACPHATATQQIILGLNSVRHHLSCCLSPTPRPIAVASFVS